MTIRAQPCSNDDHRRTLAEFGRRGAVERVPAKQACVLSGPYSMLMYSSKPSRLDEKCDGMQYYTRRPEFHNLGTLDVRRYRLLGLFIA